MRDLATIEAELKAASYEAEKLKGIVSALHKERLEVLRCRELAILEDFDAGLSRPDMMRKHGINSNTLGSIMHRNGRHYRVKVTPITSMPAEQQRHYAKLRRIGVPKRAALQAASEIGKGAAL